MKYELFDFQKRAVNTLLKKMESMRKNYEDDGSLSAVALTAPTGSGKTVISAAVTEGLFYGNDVYAGDDSAIVLWLSDNPSLNNQTLKKFDDATDLLNGATTMETIGPDFTKSHTKLQRGHVYFLNRQLLAVTGKLAKENENGRTFYDVLKDTIEDEDIHLYLFIDEAHRGLGTSADDKATSDSANKTIYAKLIDGQEGKNPPMPVVIGISATPERFNNAMNGRYERDVKAGVNIPVSEVKASGLIKDTIELRTPSKAADTKHQDLIQACAKLSQFSKTWNGYCVNNNIYPIITPLMVVQVEDKISNDTIGSICQQICKTLPWLDKSTCFANVFGEHENIATPFGNVPYINPEKVSGKDEIRILFAKDAISTGWDCPRAEVIYSRRKRSDPTYIAQLIGRMIRTPLARRIVSVEELNSVSCYLPEYDASTVKSIIQKLKEDNIGDMSDITTNSAEVTFFGDTKKNVENQLSSKKDSDLNQTKPEDTEVRQDSNHEPLPKQEEFIVNTDDSDSPFSRTDKELKDILDRIPKVDSDAVLSCFESIITRQVRHDKPNHFLDLWNCIDIIMSDMDTNSTLDQDICESFYQNVEAEIIRHPAEFKRSLTEIQSTQMSVKRIDPLTGEEFEDRIELVENDEDRLVSYYKGAVRIFDGASDIVKHYINKRMSDEFDTQKDAIKRMCAVGRCIEIVQALEVWAEEETNKLLDVYSSFRESVSEENKEKWDKIEGNTKPWVEHRLNIRSTNTYQNKDYDKYEKHIVSDKNGWAYLNIKSKLEKDVIRTELSHPLNVAWYRNEPRNLLASLSIPYDKGLGLENMYPDFIFFQNVGGKIKPSIVDPHGDWLGDSVGKLKGYVEYLKDHPDLFVRVLAVTDGSNGEIRYLDLMNKEVQDKIIAFNGSSAKELFNGPLSHPYKIVKAE